MAPARMAGCGMGRVKDGRDGRMGGESNRSPSWAVLAGVSVLKGGGEGGGAGGGCSENAGCEAALQCLQAVTRQGTMYLHGASRRELSERGRGRGRGRR